jgi:hypothetical protein
MGTLKENLKKIGTILTKYAKRYWWLVLLLYTLKGIAFLLFGWFILNA